jgi:hypothetical protein
MPGIWTNEGNHLLLDVFAKGATPPDLYVGLYMTPTTDPGVDGNGGLALTLADLTEPSEGEYARILVEPGDWTLVDNLLTAADVNFVASGLAWGIIYGWFVCDCASGNAGKLIAIEQFIDAPYNVGAAGEVKVVARLRACSGLPPLA